MAQFKCPRHWNPSMSSISGVGWTPLSDYWPSGVIRMGSPVWNCKSWKFIKTKVTQQDANSPVWLPQALKPLCLIHFWSWENSLFPLLAFWEIWTGRKENVYLRPKQGCANVIYQVSYTGKPVLVVCHRRCRASLPSALPCDKEVHSSLNTAEPDARTSHLGKQIFRLVQIVLTVVKWEKCR